MRICCLILIGMTVVFTMDSAFGQQRYTLRSTLQRARKNNPELLVSEYSIRAAETDITTANIRPNLIFNTQVLHIANRSRRQEGTGWMNSANGQYWWQVTKPFQLPGQRLTRIEYSKKLHTQAKARF